MALGTGVQYAGEYVLEECRLLSSTGVVARLDDSVIEINLFENMFTSSLMLSLVLVDKENMIMNDYLPKIEVHPETYEVRADGELLTCDPAIKLPMAQRYFLY